MDSVVWATKHTMRDIGDLGLTYVHFLLSCLELKLTWTRTHDSICVELIDNVVAAGPNTSNGFFQAYYLPLLSDMFFVLTDADHKSGTLLSFSISLSIAQLICSSAIGFKSTALVLARLIRLVETGDIQVPLDPSVTSAPGNSAFVAEHSANLLKQAFPHLQLFVSSPGFSHLARIQC